MRSPVGEIQIPAGEGVLGGTLSTPGDETGLVVFAHGSGSSRFSPRNRMVADSLNASGFATLLMDLLTSDEERAERQTRHFRFDIEMLAGRVETVIKWAHDELGLPIGLFGASTGAAAALVTAAGQLDPVRAVVSRGGRPDLAGAALPRVRVPTLLIVGGADSLVLELNERARAQMTGHVELEIVPGATHLFEEPGALDRVAELARAWFARYLVS